MADGGECDTSQQTEEEPTKASSSSSSSPAVIEILDSTTECEEELKPSVLQMEEKAFVSRLHSFMKDKGSPIERIPHLGFKQINLWRIYKAVEKRGGYELVTTQRLWKKVYDELGGSPGSTSAATCTRRHYERLVLPFERHIKGEEDKPLPPNKPRKPYKRNSDGKVKKVEVMRKRSQSDEEMDSETLPGRSSDPVLHPHPALWATDRPYPNHAPVYTLLSVPPSNPWTPAHIPSATPAEVISPLEKKKRMAQASLNLPQSPKSEDKDRPSVIRCSQSPASTGRDGGSSDGSPQPPSSSSSRSTSPLSVSSEDGQAGSGGEPATNSEQRRNCASGQDGRRHDSAQSQKETSGATSDLKNGPVKDSVRELVHKGSSKYYSQPFQPIPTSSFTKVVPKAVPLLRPAPVRPGYKVHQGRLGPHEEPQRKLNSVAPWVYPTDKRVKSRTMVQKVPPTQQSVTQSTPSLPLLYVLSGYDKSGRDSRHLPPMPPVFLPSRMRLPQSPFMYRHIPVGPMPTALTGSAVYPYPYSVPLMNHQTGYTLPNINPIYPHKL